MPRDRHELPVDAEEIGDQIATKHRTHAGRDQGRKTEIDAPAFHLGLIGGTRSGRTASPCLASIEPKGVQRRCRVVQPDRSRLRVGRTGDWSVVAA